MKKNLLWMFAAILFCGVVTTSCSKDDDEPADKPVPTPTADKAGRVEVKNYVVLASEDMLELFDVVVTNTFQKGGTSTKQLSKTTWIAGEANENIASPSTFALSVAVTPKEGVTVDAAKDYKLGLAKALTFLIQDAKMTTTLAMSGTKPDVTVAEVSGAQLTEAKLKQLADTYTLLGEETKLEVYEDYYVLDGYKSSY